MTLAFLKSPLGEDPVVSEAIFRAPPERVYKAWTDPGEIRCWFGRKPYSVRTAEIDLRVGGKWRFLFSDAEGAINAVCGEYLNIERDARLIFSWTHEQSAENGTLQRGPTSKVSVLFGARGNGTLLTIRHENIVRQDGRHNVSDGWGWALASLTSLLDTEK